MMELIRGLIDFILHIDQHLATFIGNYGGWTYALLFAIIFCETGLVVTPFLPGDSLLFTAGALAALPPPNKLSLGLLLALLPIAGIIGDTVNYTLGRSFGDRIMRMKLPFVKPQHFERTQRFYDRYGAKTIVLARFVPIVRTFAPFIAGIGKMRYATFVTYNIVGALLWVFICTLAGYFFGNIPVVKKNFELVVLGIIFVSILPLAIEYFRARRGPPNASAVEIPQ
jgi:membrane-associated protein